MTFIKEVLLGSFRGRCANDPALEHEWEEVIKPAIDDYQQEENQVAARMDAYRRKFGHRDTQPNGHPHHMPPSIMHIVDNEAPARR